jgi:glutaminyl-peptide cyclotransferase
LEDTFFGEGITVFNNQIIQLTWREKQVLYIMPIPLSALKHSNTLNLLKDGDSLMMENFCTSLTVLKRYGKLQPETFEIVDYINVYTNTGKIKSVNELEFVNGLIYANVYQKSAIAVIDAATGAVIHILNLSALEKEITNPNKDVFKRYCLPPKA